MPKIIQFEIAVRTTRQSLTNLKETLMSSDDVVILPTEIFINLVKSNAEQHDKLVQISGNMEKMFSQFEQHMQTTAQENTAMQVKIFV